MTHGDLPGGRCPAPGSATEVTSQGVAVHAAACQLYEAALDSGIDLSLEALQMRLTPPLGSALHRMLDSCHDLIYRHAHSG